MYVKTFRLVHTFYTQNAFVILLGHECLRVTQTFCTKMFVNEKYNILHTHFCTHTHHTHFIHTNTKPKCLRKVIVDILSLARTFGCARHKSYKSYLRIILVNGFLAFVLYFKVKLYVPDKTGKWVCGIVLLSYRNLFRFSVPQN